MRNSEVISAEEKFNQLEPASEWKRVNILNSEPKPIIGRVLKPKSFTNLQELEAKSYNR